jgi:fatty-acyl-CoA synthase
VIEVEDDEAPVGKHLGDVSYEALLAHGDPAYVWQLPSVEWNAGALNYTSGTTGNSKGVVTYHRGAYLNAASRLVLSLDHGAGGRQQRVRAPRRSGSVFPLIREHGVTHLCGAPIVYSMLITALAALRAGIGHTIHGLIAGAAPPAAVIDGCEAAGIELTHVYGLTEVYGPGVVCAKQESWTSLPSDERARLNGRRGVPYPLQQAVAVLDPETLQAVPADGETMGEIFFRGNVVMKGYLKNPGTTARRVVP